MKKIVSFLLVTAVAISAVCAAGSVDTVTVEGKVGMVSNFPTITSNDTTWVVPPQAFYRFAWENGIKAGDTLKIEGFFRSETNSRGQGFSEIEGLENAKMIMPNKVWVNGKAVDLSKYGEELRSGENNSRGRMMDRSDLKDRYEQMDRSNMKGRSPNNQNLRK